MNWERDSMVGSTEVFSCFIIYSLLPYLEVLFLKRNVKMCFEGGMGASGEQKEKSFWISSFLACRQGQRNNTWKAWGFAACACRSTKRLIPLFL